MYSFQVSILFLIKVSSLIGVLFATTCGLLTHQFVDYQYSVHISLLAGSVTSLTTFLILQLFTVEYAVNLFPTGIFCHHKFEGRTFVGWQEVEKVTYSKLNGLTYVSVITTDGREVIIPTFIKNIDQFRRLVQLHAGDTHQLVPYF